MRARTALTRCSVGALVASSAAWAGAWGCGPAGPVVPLRSLERSGPVAAICLASPSDPAGAARPMSACSSLRTEDPRTFTATDVASIPHVYALVTQVTRGELAVVDLTANAENLLDTDASTPGAGFLPVGATPVSLTVSDGGTAVFVASADPGRAGLYALPSAKLRACAEVDPGNAGAGGAGGAGGAAGAGGGVPSTPRGCADSPPTLATWPSCSLPAAPADVVLVSDPAVGGLERASCDGAFESPSPPADPSLDLVSEGRGRQKLVVSLPDLGGVAVIDAQALLSSSPGEFAPCDVERWLPLEAELPPPPAPPASSGGACVEPAPPEPLPVSVPDSRPSSLAQSGDRVFVGDLAAPVIHAIRMASPCEPDVEPPLLATSAVDPSRVVTTSEVAASEPTLALERFVYAVDDHDGSLMVFDVSDGATSRQPLRRPRAELQPLQPPDRLRFGAPVVSVAFVQRDEPQRNPVSDELATGVRCDADPALSLCIVGAQSCDDATLYRNNSDYNEGAGPLTLRGTFALALLSSGQLSWIDVDDLDAGCRLPQSPSSLAGCDGLDLPAGTLQSTDEASCRVVVPHEPRSAVYVLTNDAVAGRHEPGLQSLPLFLAPNGTVQQVGEGVPRMVAAIDPNGAPLQVSVGSQRVDLAGDGTASVDGPKNALVMNLEDPRAHAVDQVWNVVFEGRLPLASNRTGRIELKGGSTDGLVDPTTRFCAAGVRSEAALLEQLAADGSGGPSEARALADVVVVTSELLDVEDGYWQGAECTYEACLARFGTQLEPTPSRDLRVVEAYQDRLVLAPPSYTSELDCCFPGTITYDVRGSDQWIAVGTSSGFLHHVIADPATGACRDSCDARLARMKGRIRPAPGLPVASDSPYALVTPFFRVGITAGSALRDSGFRFVTQGSFASLAASLRPDGANVLPVGLTWVPTTDSVLVTDGLFEGLLVVNAGTASLSSRFF